MNCRKIFSLIIDDAFENITIRFHHKLFEKSSDILDLLKRHLKLEMLVYKRRKNGLKRSPVFVIFAQNLERKLEFVTSCRAGQFGRK